MIILVFRAGLRSAFDVTGQRLCTVSGRVGLDYSSLLVMSGVGGLAVDL
jgi:hypothetical protein